MDKKTKAELLRTLEAEAKTWEARPYHGPERANEDAGKAWGLRRAADLVRGKETA